MKNYFCDEDYFAYLDLLTEFRGVVCASISVNAGRGIFGRKANKTFTEFDRMVVPKDPQEIMGSLIN